MTQRRGKVSPLTCPRPSTSLQHNPVPPAPIYHTLAEAGKRFGITYANNFGVFSVACNREKQESGGGEDLKNN